MKKRTLIKGVLISGGEGAHNKRTKKDKRGR